MGYPGDILFVAGARRDKCALPLAGVQEVELSLHLGHLVVRVAEAHSGPRSSLLTSRLSSLLYRPLRFTHIEALAESVDCSTHGLAFLRTIPSNV